MENFDSILRLRPETTIKDTDDGWLMYPWRVAIIWGQMGAFRHICDKYPFLVDLDPRGKNLFGWTICTLAVMDAGDNETLKAVINCGFDVNCQIALSHTSYQG